MTKINVEKKIEVKDGKKKQEPTITIELTQEEATAVEVMLERAMREQMTKIEKPSFRVRRQIRKNLTSIEELREGYQILHSAEQKITKAIVCDVLGIEKGKDVRIFKCKIDEKA